MTKTRRGVNEPKTNANTDTQLSAPEGKMKPNNGHSREATCPVFPKFLKKQFTIKILLMHKHKVTQLSVFRIKTEQNRLHPM